VGICLEKPITGGGVSIDKFKVELQDEFSATFAEEPFALARSSREIRMSVASG